MRKGEIYISATKKTKHPFVFISDINVESFNACMITH